MVATIAIMPTAIIIAVVVIVVLVTLEETGRRHAIVTSITTLIKMREMTVGARLITRIGALTIITLVGGIIITITTLITIEVVSGEMALVLESIVPVVAAIITIIMITMIVVAMVATIEDRLEIVLVTVQVEDKYNFISFIYRI